jgi:SAM-dependent methyltransferase
MLLSAGAEHVTAVEPSKAFEVLVKNVCAFADRVTCLNIRGDEVLEGNFDLALSIGVLHHIPDPKPVLRSVLQALKPGGRLLIWVYGHEGSALYRAIFTPLRIATCRLPVKVNEAIAAILDPMLLAYGYLTRLFPSLPLSDYLKNVLFRFEPDQRRLVILDQINPHWARYYRREEIEGLLRDCGFRSIASHHRHGYSWTVTGLKPT